MQAVRSEERDPVTIRPTRLSVRPLAEELPSLLAERDLSLRGLAERIGVTHSHLSRATRGANGKTVGGDLAGRIAIALGLPADYFPEYREAVVIERLRCDPTLRDRLYRQATRQR
jgi:transcriptional regulator with XRE-family HTH domain